MEMCPWNVFLCIGAFHSKQALTKLTTISERLSKVGGDQKLKKRAGPTNLVKHFFTGPYERNQLWRFGKLKFTYDGKLRRHSVSSTVAIYGRSRRDSLGYCGSCSVAPLQ